MNLRIAKSLGAPKGTYETQPAELKDFEKHKPYKGLLELNYLQSYYPEAIFYPLQNAIMIIKEDKVQVTVPFDELKAAYLRSGVEPLIRSLPLFDPSKEVTFTFDYKDDFTFTVFEAEENET